VTKQYQRKKTGARDALELAVPDRVSVVMADVADDMREGLLALAVGAGLQVMSALMEADVTALTGPRGRHDAERVAVRHATGAGSVTLGGRRVGVQRARVRAVDGSGELAVPAYELFSCAEILGRMGDGTDAVRPVDPPVRGGPGTGRGERHDGREGHLEVRGLAPVREDDRDRPGGPARRGPVRGWTWSRSWSTEVHFAQSCCVVALGIDID
jgi:hypothetical protein